MSGPLLEGEVALITGGGSGLGLAIARRFMAEGARVAVFDRSAPRLAALRDEFGSAVVTVEGDVRRLSDNVAAVQHTVAAFGKLSIFVGNAGIYDHRVSLLQMPAESIEAAFDEMFGIDVKGYILGAKAAADELVRSRGNIIFTTSVSGVYAGYGGFLYVTAKHAVSGLARHLAVELAPAVRVNAVAPGYVPTNLVGLETLQQGATKSGRERSDSDFLLERVPTADDYTMLYALVASRSSAAVLTGSVILADGGGSIHRT